MTTSPESALRLLIVDDSVEDAEGIVSALRNDGIAVRPYRASSAAELNQILQEHPIDLILAAAASALPLTEVARIGASSGKDIPVLALIDPAQIASISKLHAAGARRVALRGETAQLLHSIRYEWHDLDHRRRLRRLDAQLREAERRADALMESSRDPIAYVHEGMHIRANAAYLEMFGFDDFGDIEGMSLLDLIAAKDVDGFKQVLKAIGKGEPPPPRHELEAVDSAGVSFPATMEFAAAAYQGEPCLQVVFRRQEFDPELARQFEELKQRDQVTGLLNRQTFLHALEAAVADAAQNGGQHGLLLMEPDHYQRLVQEIGLDSADAVVAALAERLRIALHEHPDAVTARFGEHTLAVLIRGDHQRTHALAEQIRTQMGGVLAVRDHSSMVSMSIGGVHIGEKIASLTQILAKASQGLQSAIGVGGNRAEIFDPSAIDRAEEDRIRAWVERLRAALANDEFTLHYQPVINLRGESRPLYEAFIRLDTGDAQPVMPSTFIEVAQEHGLLSEIDRWVIERAISELARSFQAHKPVSMMVKVSQESLANNALLDHIQRCLDKYRVPGQNLLLQLVEAKVFTQLHAAQKFFARARQIGCQIVLEQFGNGLDSFQLLTHLQPQYLKLDRSFSLGLASHPGNQKRVQEIVKRAHQDRILTIAEFVEDAASMTSLFSAGIDYVQGHFLAAPAATMNYEFDI